MSNRCCVRIFLGVMALALSGCVTNPIKDGMLGLKGNSILGTEPVPEKPVRVNFAGISMLGSLKKEAPEYLAEYARANNSGDKIYQKMLDDKSPYYQLYQGLSGDKGEDGVVLSLAIDRTSFLDEKIGGSYKLVSRVYSQMLLFDFDTMKLLASYPIDTACVDIRPNPFSKEDRVDIATKLFYEGIGKCESIVRKFTEIFKDIRPKLSYGNFLKVGDVTVSQKAKSHLPSAYKGIDAAINIAQSISGELSKYQKVPILPYSVDRAIGSTMATRFSNGRVFDLEIPEADYVINVNIKDAGNGVLEETKHQELHYYYVTSHIKLSEPLSETNYIDMPVRNVELKRIPKAQDALNNSSAFDIAFRDTFRELSLALNEPSTEWANKFTGRAENIAQLKSAKSIIESCK